MSRRPAHLDMVGGKGPRQRIWEVIREFSREGKDITTDAICRRVDVNLTLIQEYIRGLYKANYLAVKGEVVRCKPNVYLLANDVGAEAPRVTKTGEHVTQGLEQEQMWRTLRTIKGDINARELAAFSTTEDVSVAENAAKSYLQNLKRANYLQCVSQGKGCGYGGVLARYRLISNTGPRPPMVQRTDAIYDPNLGAVVWMRPIDEETAIYGH